MSTAVLETQDLHKSYGKGSNRFDALKGVSLSIGRGESLAIVGKSGSGKSTLMHLLALLDSPSSGQIFLNGNDAARLKGRNLNRARNRTFGFVFQQFFLVPNASVLDNVIMPLKIAGIGQRARRVQGMESYFSWQALPPPVHRRSKVVASNTNRDNRRLRSSGPRTVGIRPF